MDIDAIIKYFGFMNTPLSVILTLGFYTSLRKSKKPLRNVNLWLAPRDAIKVCFELLIELVSQRKQQATAKQVEEIAKGQTHSIFTTVTLSSESCQI